MPPVVGRVRVVHEVSRGGHREGVLIEQRLSGGNVHGPELVVERQVPDGIDGGGRLFAADVLLCVHGYWVERQNELRDAGKMSRPDVGVIFDSGLAWLEVDQARAVFAVRVAAAQADARVASAQFVVVLRRRRDVVIEATGRASAEHRGTGLVHALVELCCADVALLVVVVRGTGDDLGIRRVYGAASLACVRLDRDRSPRRLRTSGDLALRC